MVPFQQIIDVPVYETVAADCFKQQVQIKPQVFKVDKPVSRIEQNLCHFTAEFFKQAGDNVAFSFEVLMQIAGADIEFLGNLVGRYVDFTVPVKQLQAGVKNPLTGIAAGHWRCLAAIAVQGFNQIDVLLHRLFPAAALQRFPGPVLGGSHEVKK